MDSVAREKVESVYYNAQGWGDIGRHIYNKAQEPDSGIPSGMKDFGGYASSKSHHIGAAKGIDHIYGETLTSGDAGVVRGVAKEQKICEYYPQKGGIEGE